MRGIARLILFLLLSAVMQQVQAAPQTGVVHTAAPKQIERIQAVYDVQKDSIRIATISETYIRTKDRYRIESVSKAVGLLALFKPETIRTSSEGVLTAQGLRPVTFIQTRELDTERNVRAELDWAAKRITLTDRNGKHTQSLQGATQDRLSAMYQFMFTPLHDATALSFNMTNGSKMDEYGYRVTRNQSVTVPLGTFDALYLVSAPEPGSKRQTEIWLATGHANFPYKMVVTESNGDKLTQVLTRFDIEP
jgi:hypothetical protein